MKYICSEDAVTGVHKFTEELQESLKSKHPAAKQACEQVMLSSDAEFRSEPVIFESISGALIQRLSKEVQGSGGPSQLDADNWKLMTNASMFKPHSDNLCEAVADLTKRLATEQVSPDLLQEFTSSRLIALDKNPGIRPIGVGEIIRRVCSKAVLFVIRDDIQAACGPLQTCTGIKSGSEAAIHAMRGEFSKDETEGMLLVDAENAFNAMNREVALNNVKSICPPFFSISAKYVPRAFKINHSRCTEWRIYFF